MRRYANQTDLFDRLKKLRRGLAIEIQDARPPAPTAPRVHKLDDRMDSQLVARVVAEYEAGTPSTHIGPLFALSKNSVTKILRDAGIEIRLPRMSEAETQRAIQLYNDGQSLVEVGNRLGRSHSTVYKTLKRAGVRTRDSHGRSR